MYRFNRYSFNTIAELGEQNGDAYHALEGINLLFGMLSSSSSSSSDSLYGEILYDCSDCIGNQVS